MAGNIAVAISAFVIASIIITNSSMAIYGEFIVLQAFFGIWVVISKPLTWQAIIKFMPDEAIGRLVKKAAILELKVYLLTVTVTIFGLYSYDSSIVSDYGYGILIASVFGFFVNSGPVLGGLRSVGEFHWIALIMFLVSISKIVLACFYFDSVYELFYLSLSIEGIIWAAFFVYVVVFKFEQVEKCIVDSSFKRFSFWGWGQAVVDLPLTQFDRLLVSMLMGLEVAGAYNLMKRISQAVGQVADPLYQLSFPEFSRLVKKNKIVEIKGIVKKVSSLIVLLSGFLVLAFLLLFDYFDKILFSEGLFYYKFETLLFLIIQCFSLSFVWVHSLFISFGYVRESFAIVLVSNIIFVACIYLFGNAWGLWGIVLSVLIQNLLVVFSKFRLMFIDGRLNVEGGK